MGDPIRPGDPTTDRITRTVAAMKSQGASDDDIHTYLTQHEGLKLANPSPKPLGDGFLGGAESLTQGLLGGFADEIGGAGAAGIDAIGDMIHGRPTHFSADYANYRDTARHLETDFSQAHPVAHAALETVGGAVPAMITGGATEAAIGARLAPSLGRKVLASAVTGGVTSGIFGAGNADGSATDRLVSGAKAVPVGAAVGAVAPIAGKALAQLPKLVRSTTGIGSRTEALRQIGEVVNQTGKTADDIAVSAAANKAAGSPVLLADELGDTGRKLVRWTVNQPAEGGADLKDVLENRQLGQYDRLMAGLKSAFGSDPANIPATKDALLAAKRANAAPAYQAAYAEAPYSSPTVDAATRVPSFRSAIAKGEDLAYNDDVVNAIKNGDPVPQRPPRIGAKPKADPKLVEANAQLAKLVNDYPGMHPDAVAHAARALGADPASLTATAADEENGVTGAQIPIKVLDYAKRYLDTGIRRGFDSQSTFDHATAQGTSGLLGHVLNEVDQARPAYNAARALYHSDSRMEEIADLGAKALHLTPDELQSALKGATPDEMDVARKTFLGAYKNAAGSVADRNDLAKRFLADPNMRQRFQIMAPDQAGYSALNDLGGRETRMAKTYSAATGNSTTAEQMQMNSSMNGGITPADIAVLPLSPHRTLARMAGRLGQSLRDQSNVKLANQVGPMLSTEPGSQDFNALIDALKRGNTSANGNLPSTRSLFSNALLQAFTAQGRGQQNP